MTNNCLINKTVDLANAHLESWAEGGGEEGKNPTTRFIYLRGDQQKICWANERNKVNFEERKKYHKFNVLNGEMNEKKLEEEEEEENLCQKSPSWNMRD